jgi:hypothetical protein
MRLSPALLELDSLIINIELTLASIVQGVALTFLIENTRTVLSIRDAATWLYVLTGLCIIFIFWSRSILHTLTLIRWPLELGYLWYVIRFFRKAAPLVVARQEERFALAQKRGEA